MTERPTGTVSFLFTDIEGSTLLLRELGGEYRDALDDHRRLLREVFSRYQGYEVDTQGDAFFVAFHRAQDAARAAHDAQTVLAAHTWPSGHDLRVRIGIHTCEATATAEGYVGIGVHRGARICSAGHGGQVVVSQATHDLLQDEEIGTPLVDLGEHRLKDLSQPQRLFQLVVDGVADVFPPLRTLENRLTNLPVQPTQLIGREREVAELRMLLERDGVRLVTLTGPGGTGKTRLALQVAAELVEVFPDGVFFVALAPIVDSQLVVPAIAQMVGVNEAAGQSFSAYLATKKLLLILDNFEQVSSAAPQLAELLTEAADLRLLVTSREPLRLQAERRYAVSPLGLPDPKNLPPPSALSQYESVALFIERARMVQSEFEVTSSNAAAVAELCVRLDGLPLALELAAARIGLLSPESMLERIGERLQLLAAGSRDLPARQQTLRNTLAWSYDLLSGDEQQLFARLGIFAGGFTLDAAEEICDADLDALASLVEKNLIRREGERFALLETIREYALDRFNEGGDEDDVRAGHASYFLALAERAYAERIEVEAEWSQRLEEEHDNLRAAIEWFHGIDPTGELRLTGALGWFWRVHSHLTEGRELLGRALEHDHDRDAAFARALTSVGNLAAWQGDLAGAKPPLDEAIAAWETLGQDIEQAFALEALGWGQFMGGDDLSARDAFERSLALQQRSGNEQLVIRAQLGLCVALVSQGDLATAERSAAEALAFAEQENDSWARHLAHHYLADCALIAEDFPLAEERYLRSLQAAAALGDRSEIAVELQGVAMAAAGCSRPVRAMRLAGAAAAELDLLGVDVSGVRFWSELLEKNLGRARTELGPLPAAEFWEEGRQLRLDEAVSHALGRTKD